mgnify:CR=1 FL=1
MDTILRNCRLRGRDGLWDIGIQDGRFAALEPKLGTKGGREIDAGGHLVSPPFIDPHLHLDAVLSVGDPGTISREPFWRESKSGGSESASSPRI